MLDEKTIYFAGRNESVIIPNKREEDAGYDIYANFETDLIIIKPHETKMIPTGLYSAFNPKWYIQLEERGSTGTKGIAQRCGVIDSGFRDEWFIPLTNTTEKIIAIVKEEKVELMETYYGDNVIIYPYEKAICQAVLHEVPKVEVKQLSVKELQAIPSKRGTGMLGSSNK